MVIYYKSKRGGILFHVFDHRLNILFFPAMFNSMFQLIFCQESTEHCKKQHEKLPEIMRPFFSGSMGVGMYFHKNYLKSYSSFKIESNSIAIFFNGAK